MDESPTFCFKHSTRIVFGPGVLASLSLESRTLRASRALIVCDPGVTQLGFAHRVADLLLDAGIEAARFDALSENPRNAECCAAAATARDVGAEFIVGLGGGSAMDAAKAAAALVTNGGSVMDWEDPKELACEPLPIVCIPTTAGTGSEVTFVAVITDDTNHHKMALRDSGLAPRIALVDPELTTTMPAALTAATGMDAISHAIEAYTCKAANPVSDALAVRAIELIAHNLRTAYGDGADLSARSAMQLGSTMAGMAFANSTVGAVHSIAESLGGRYDTPHGVAVAVFLPTIFRFNISADPQRHADVARALGVEPPIGKVSELAERGAVALGDLARDVGIPPLAELPGIRPTDFDQLAETSAASGCSKANPRPITRADYLGILRDAYQTGSPSDTRRRDER